MNLYTLIERKGENGCLSRNRKLVVDCTWFAIRNECLSKKLCPLCFKEVRVNMSRRDKSK